MSLTIDQVIKAHAAMDALVQADRKLSYSIPKSTRLTMAKNLAAAIPVLKDYEQQHNALVAKNGYRNKEGQWVIDDQKKKEIFAIERGDLGASQTEIAAFDTVNYADFPEGVPIDLIAIFITTGLLVT